MDDQNASHGSYRVTKEGLHLLVDLAKGRSTEPECQETEAQVPELSGPGEPSCAAALSPRPPPPAGHICHTLRAAEGNTRSHLPSWRDTERQI